MKWLGRLGLRTRLMVIGLSGLTVALAVGGFVFYNALLFSITRTLDNEALSAAGQVAAMVDADQIPDPIPISGAQIVQIIDQQGRVVGGSVTADRLTPLLRPTELAAAVGGSAITVSGARAGLDGPLRVVGVAAGPADDRRHIVVALQIRDLDHSTSVLRVALLIGFPVLVALLGAIAWRVIGWTLRPVEGLRAAAERISGTGRSESLPVPTSNDEIRSLAETLNSMLARLSAARARQRDFVADAAHELRSPLASIRVQLEVAQHLGRNGTLPAEVLLDVERLSAVVEDLLFLARVDADARGPANPTSFDVRELLREIAAENTGHSVVVTRGPGPAVEIIADRDEIRRAITNLVANSLRYADARVELDVDRDVQNVAISVADDGPGIAVADRERIFERFTRLDDARARDSGGSGLGLPIVRELIRRAGGTLAFQDVPTGSRVEVLLPVAHRLD